MLPAVQYINHMVLVFHQLFHLAPDISKLSFPKMLNGTGIIYLLRDSKVLAELKKHICECCMVVWKAFMFPLVGHAVWTSTKKSYYAAALEEHVGEVFRLPDLER